MGMPLACTYKTHILKEDIKERIVRDSWGTENQGDQGRNRGRVGLDDGVEAADSGEQVQGTVMTRV